MPNNKFEGKKVLITGGTGFIGRHLSNNLFLQGAKVNVTSRKSETQIENGIHIWNLDLTQIRKVEKFVSTLKPDLIFHLASMVKGSRELDLVMPMLRNNLITTVNILTAAKKFGCDRVILAGSMEEPNNEFDSIPNSPYSAAKWASTGYGKMFQSLYDLPVVILKIFMVYGPGQMDFSKLVPYTIRQAFLGKRPEVSKGNRKIDWIYIDDVIDGFIAAALSNKAESTILDIGTGKSISIKEFVTEITKKINPVVIPKFGAVPDRKNEYSRVANIQETYKMTKWAPKISLSRGLELTINWYSKLLKNKS